MTSIGRVVAGRGLEGFDPMSLEGLDPTLLEGLDPMLLEDNSDEVALLIKGLEGTLVPDVVDGKDVGSGRC